MSHTPFGYRIKNGKAIVDVEEAEKIRVLFQAKRRIISVMIIIRLLLMPIRLLRHKRKSPAGPKNWGASGNLKKRHRFYTPPPSPLQKKRKPILIHFSKLNMPTV